MSELGITYVGEDEKPLPLPTALQLAISVAREQEMGYGRPVATCCALNLDTGAAFFGFSGHDLTTGVLHKRLLEKRSFNRSHTAWGVKNCAEVEALHKLFESYPDAEWSRIELATVNTVNQTPKERCSNCLILTMECVCKTGP